MISGWTIETLKAHVDERFIALKEATANSLVAQKELYQTVQSAADKAITKSEDAQRQYNTSHNDLLKKMEDQLPRKEADVRDKNYEDKFEVIRKEISKLTTRLDIIAGRGTGIQQFIGWIVALLAIAGFIISNVKIN
jgi:hypothetical protein